MGGLGAPAGESGTGSANIDAPSASASTMVPTPAGDDVIGSANFRDDKLPPDAPVGDGTEGTKFGNMTTTR